MGENCPFHETDTALKFHNYCLNKEISLSHVDETAMKWLENKVPKISVEEGLQLKVVLARLVFRASKVLVWVIKLIGKLLPNQVL